MVTIQYHKDNLRVLSLIPLHTLSNKYYHQITIEPYYHRELNPRAHRLMNILYRSSLLKIR
jgi:hypothetical protein